MVRSVSFNTAILPSPSSTNALSSGSRLQARQSATPPPPCTADTITTGYIAATNYGGTEAQPMPDGYVGTTNAFGQYTWAKTTATALRVSIRGCLPQGPSEITVLVSTEIVISGKIDTEQCVRFRITTQDIHSSVEPGDLLNKIMIWTLIHISTCTLLKLLTVRFSSILCYLLTFKDTFLS